MITFFERIKNLLSQSGKSKNLVAKELGLNHNFFIDLEKGQIPSGERILKLARYFNVTTDYLLGLSDEPQQKSSPDVAGEHDKLAKILSDYMTEHNLQIKDENELKIALDTFAAVVQSLQKDKE